ncbi:hypothetical protein LTR74_012723 [Friedmanniomyces endolithicus]|nr:hypothetical protein LTR74_012723 [Friedmanniomyces endolithicus]
MPSAHGLDVYLTHCSTPYAERHITPETAAFRNPFCIPAQRVIVRRRLPAYRAEIAHLTLHAGFNFAMGQANALHIGVMVGSKEGVTIWDEVLIGAEIKKIRAKGFLLWGPTMLPKAVEGPDDSRGLKDSGSARSGDILGNLNVAIMRGRASGKGFRKLWRVDRDKFKEVSKERRLWLRDTEFQRLQGAGGWALRFKFQVLGQESHSGPPARPTLGLAEEQKANPAVLSPDPAPRSASTGVESHVEERDGERKPSQAARTPLLSSPTTAPVLSGNFQAPGTPVQDLKPIIDRVVSTDREKLPSTWDAKESNSSDSTKVADTTQDPGRRLTSHDSQPDSNGSNQGFIAIGNVDVTVDGFMTAAIKPTSRVPAKLTDAAARAIEKLKRLSFQNIAQTSAIMISAPSAEPVLRTLPVQRQISGPAASDFVDLAQPTAKEVLTELRKEAVDLAGRARIPQNQPHLTKIVDHSTSDPTRAPEGTTQPLSFATSCDHIKAEPASVTHPIGELFPMLDVGALGKRKASVMDEGSEDEEELRDQIVEIELEKKMIGVRRKLRELGRKKRLVGEV